ncbi:MAG: DUF6599 family protein [Planctomycetota bacterium]
MRPVSIPLLMSSILATAGAPSPAIGEEPPIDLRTFYPEPAAIDPAMTGEDLRKFDRESLYDYIDGGAEVYLALGFREVGARDYVLPGGAPVCVTLDIYDMGAPLGAYAIYCAEVYAEAQRLRVGVAGWIGGGSAVFWSNRYYVKIRADDDTQAVTKILTAMASQVAARIGPPGEVPPETRLFPARDRVKASERYSARQLLGVGSLQGFSCRYEKDGRSLALHLGHFKTEADAIRAEEALAAHLKTEVRRSSGEAWEFIARPLGRGRVLRAGKFLAVAQRLRGEAGEDAWALSLFDEFTAAVAKAALEEARLEARETALPGQAPERGVSEDDGRMTSERRK